MTRNFISGYEFSQAEVQAMIETALAFKRDAKNIARHPDKIITLLFANSSLRTNLSFASGIKKMGGGANIMTMQNAYNFEYRDNVVMDGDTQEHIKEAAAVISAYSDLIGLRHSSLIGGRTDSQQQWSLDDVVADTPIQQLARYARKPVINMESNMYHPCQGLADIMTIYEMLGGFTGKKCVVTWAPHPRPLPLATPHSQLMMPALMGMDVVLACPPGFLLHESVLAAAKEKANSLEVMHDQKQAFVNADVVIAKSWASLSHFGQWQQEQSHRQQFSDWTIDGEIMKTTNNAIFMHCLPCRRNVIATDEVMDAPYSKIIDEAENRMWGQMALMDKMLANVNNFVLDKPNDLG